MNVAFWTHSRRRQGCLRLEVHSSEANFLLYFP